MSCNADPRPTTYEEWDALEADRDRLASDLQATRAELERVRLANRVLDSAAKDAQAWAYQLQECRAELARVRRNHMRRMLYAIQFPTLVDGQESRFMRQVHRLIRTAERFRAALATMETGRA